MKKETSKTKTTKSIKGVFESIYYLDGRIEQFANDDTLTGSKENENTWKEYSALRKKFNKNNEWKETIEVRNSLFAIHSVLLARKTL